MKVEEIHKLVVNEYYFWNYSKLLLNKKSLPLFIGRYLVIRNLDFAHYSTITISMLLLFKEKRRLSKGF